MAKLYETKVITIKDNDYEVTIHKLDASKGIVLGTKLAKIILPVVGGLADEMFSEEKEDETKTFTEMAGALLSQLDTIDVLGIIKELLRGLSVDGDEVDFNKYFMANYGLLVEIIAFALKENFESFFEALGLKDRIFSMLGTKEDQAESDA